MRLIVPAVPMHDVFEHGGNIARARMEFQAASDHAAERMRQLVLRTRGLPCGYPTLAIQRRAAGGSHALRWMDSRYRMLSEDSFLRVIEAFPARTLAWYRELHLEARWLNSHTRICRFVSNEYLALAAVAAPSSSSKS